MTEKKEIETKNIFQKISEARVLLQKRSLKKSGENRYAGFKYFELADFLPSVNEIFAEVGLCSWFYIEDEHMEDVSSTEEPYYVLKPARAHLNIINTDNTNEIMRFSSSIADAAMKGASPIQMLGSVHTYMRRYLWLEAMEITECDGVDALNQREQIEVKPTQEAKPKVLPATPEQVAKIETLFNGDSERMDKMMAVYRVDQLSQLNTNQAANIIRRLEGKK